MLGLALHECFTSAVQQCLSSAIIIFQALPLLPGEPVKAIPHFSKDRLYPLRQRLRAGTLPRRGAGAEAGLAPPALSCSTPSPSVSSRPYLCSPPTFIGYRILGLFGERYHGGIFLPFFFVAAQPRFPDYANRAAGAFLDAVNIGAVGIMAAVVLQLGGEADARLESLIIAGLGALVLVFAWK